MKRLYRALPTPREIWSRSGTLVRLTLYLAGVEIFLYLLKQVFRLFDWPNAAVTLSTWLVSIGIICLVLGSFIFLRWLRKKVMWRLRNRLIITYVFIGVIPVILLLALALVATELLAGQFATFLATSDLQTRIDSLDTST